jgi:cytoskeletal protein CcmA (bactofilin family)
MHSNHHHDKEVAMSEPTNGEYPTIIGPDAVFKGALSFEKGVRLLGQFEGEIQSKGNLLVAEGARLAGDVKAGSVRIDGTVSGNLETSGKIQLSATAKLEGDLRGARLEVADGATFVGRVVVGPQNGKVPTPEGPNADASKLADKNKQQPQPQPAMAGKR